MVWQHTLESLQQSLITLPPKSTNSFYVVIITKRRKEANRDKTKIRVGTSGTVKVGEIDEKIREGESRSMRKDLVGLYYLAHTAYVLIISRFCWLVPVFSMVYRWWTPVMFSSENPIHVLTILFHLSISLPYSWRLMIVWTILISALFVDMGSGIVTSLSKNSSAFLPSCMRRVMSPPLSTIRSGMWSLSSSSGYIKSLRMQYQYSSRISPF